MGCPLFRGVFEWWETLTSSFPTYVVIFCISFVFPELFTKMNKRAPSVVKFCSFVVRKIRQTFWLKMKLDTRLKWHLDFALFIIINFTFTSTMMILIITMQTVMQPKIAFGSRYWITRENLLCTLDSGEIQEKRCLMFETQRYKRAYDAGFKMQIGFVLDCNEGWASLRLSTHRWLWLLD